jgi:hypothetical protein
MALVRITSTKVSDVPERCYFAHNDAMKQHVRGTRSDKEATPSSPLPENTSSKMILQLTGETSTQLHPRHSYFLNNLEYWNYNIHS